MPGPIPLIQALHKSSASEQIFFFKPQAPASLVHPQKKGQLGPLSIRLIALPKENCRDLERMRVEGWTPVLFQKADSSTDPIQVMELMLPLQNRALSAETEEESLSLSSQVTPFKESPQLTRLFQEAQGCMVEEVDTVDALFEEEVEEESLPLPIALDAKSSSSQGAKEEEGFVSLVEEKKKSAPESHTPHSTTKTSGSYLTQLFKVKSVARALHLAIQKLNAIIEQQVKAMQENSEETARQNQASRQQEDLHREQSLNTDLKNRVKVGAKSRFSKERTLVEKSFKNWKTSEQIAHQLSQFPEEAQPVNPATVQAN